MAGLRLADLNWLDLRAIVLHCPRTSALFRATNVDWWVTPEVKLLRDIADAADWLVLHPNAMPASGEVPRRRFLSDAEIEQSGAKRTYASMSEDEAYDFLGWQKKPYETQGGGDG